MSKKPEQFVNELKSLGMKPEAKAAMREHLAAYAELHTTPEVTPKTVGLSWQILFVRIGMSMAVLVLVFVVSGAGAIMAARSSLPGDLLYPVKVRVYEPLQLANADTAEEIAVVKLAQYEERKRELNALSQDRRLNSQTQRRLESSVAAAETEAREAAAELAKEDTDRAETLLAQLPTQNDEPEPVRVAVVDITTDEVERTVVESDPEPAADVFEAVAEPIPTQTITRKSLQQQLDDVAATVSEIETRLTTSTANDEAIETDTAAEAIEPVETEADDVTTIIRTKPSSGGGSSDHDDSTDDEPTDDADDVVIVDPVTDEDTSTSTATSTDDGTTNTDEEPADEEETKTDTEETDEQTEPTPTVGGASTTVGVNSINVVKLVR